MACLPKNDKRLKVTVIHLNVSNQRRRRRRSEWNGMERTNKIIRSYFDINYIRLSTVIFHLYQNYAGRMNGPSESVCCVSLK